MVNLPNFEVILGTYEEYLLGYKITLNDEKLELKQSFATHEHSSSLRTVTTCGKYLASGGADDRICVYDMLARKDHVMLTHHNSTINNLEFTCENTHLISSSIDGVLAITRVGNWVLEKIWEKAHKTGYVIAMAVHPTGKLALTLGSDSSLQTWNLIKGRKAYIINLNSKSTDPRSLHFIKWGPCGDKFILGGGENIEIWNISSGGILKAFNYKSKIICATWISEELIVIGHENGVLSILNIENDSMEEYEAYSNRVKCVEYKNKFLVTASSSGCIKIWSVDGVVLNEVSQCNSGCRITCMALVDGLKVKKVEKEETTDERTIENTEIKKKIIKPLRNVQRIIIEEGSDDEEAVKNKKNKKANGNKQNFVADGSKNKRKRNKKRKFPLNVEQTDEIVTKNDKEIDEVEGIKKNKAQKTNTSNKIEEEATNNKPKNKKKRKSQTWDVQDI